MTTIGNITTGILILPTGATVGDEFRIAGKVRVVNIAEEQVDVTSFQSREHQYIPQRTAGLALISVTIKENT